MTYVSHDFYYRDLSHLPFEERAKVNFDHPDALETSLLVTHLAKLKAGESVEMPIYDFAEHTRREESRRCGYFPCTNYFRHAYLRWKSEIKLTVVNFIHGITARRLSDLPRAAAKRREQGSDHHRRYTDFLSCGA